MVSTSFLNQSGLKITISKPRVLLIGTGLMLKIINAIKTRAHLILAQVEGELIFIQACK
jgi:hypothetical protein